MFSSWCVTLSLDKWHTCNPSPWHRMCVIFSISLLQKSIGLIDPIGCQVGDGPEWLCLSLIRGCVSCLVPRLSGMPDLLCVTYLASRYNCLCEVMIAPSNGVTGEGAGSVTARSNLWLILLHWDLMMRWIHNGQRETLQRMAEPSRSRLFPHSISVMKWCGRTERERDGERGLICLCFVRLFSFSQTSHPVEGCKKNKQRK